MNELQVIENNGQRVLTTAQIAESYGTDSKAISKNFANNRSRYIEGKHFFYVSGESMRAIRKFYDLPKNVNSLYLWTEKGALLHAKSINTDMAWEVYDKLVETYFRVQGKKNLPGQLNPDKAKALAVKEMNARVRMSNQFLKLARVDTLSSEYKSILIAKSAEVLTGKPLLPLPKSEQRTYTATEIGEMFGVTAQKIGSLSNKHNMKTDEYGGWYRDKSPYSSKEVDAFRYNDKAVERFRELLC